MAACVEVKKYAEVNHYAPTKLPANAGAVSIDHGRRQAPRLRQYLPQARRPTAASTLR